MNNQSTSSVKTAAQDIKRLNRRRIYNLLRSGGSYSRRDIVLALGLSLPTVVQNITDMQEEGLVHEVGQQTKTGGRRAMTYASVNDFRTAIGMDVTRHHVSAVAVDLCGNILARTRIRLDFSRSPQYYAQLGALTSELIANADIDPQHILGVGISVPCLTNETGTRSYYCKALDTDELIAADFAEYIPFHVSLCHDTTCSAYAENWFSPSTEDFFYLMLSHSIGGSVFIHGGQYNGDNCRSCEIGHTQLIQNGRKCYCGHRGCADPYCSAKALVTLTDGDLPRFFDLLGAGNKDAAALWQEYLGYLAMAIHNIHMLYDCKIVLGGQIGERMGPYIGPLRTQLAIMDPFIENADYISVCNANIESAAVGAALSFIGSYVSSI